MKILHLCMCGPFSDGFNYQENLLAKYHKRLGYDVFVVASRWKYNSNGELELSEQDSYVNDDGVRIIRIDLKKGQNFNSKFKRYPHLEDVIKKIKPDIIFIHGCQFLDIKKVANYAKSNKVKIFVDNHADFSNSATNFISLNILHKIIWRHCAKIIEPYTVRFYGVLPARVDFLINVYKIDYHKVELLVMGVDDDLVDESLNKNSIAEIRNKYGIDKNDFLIATGGKIDLAKKQTILLERAIKECPNKRVKLLIFGSIVPELKEDVLSYCDGKRIIYVGWLNNEQICHHIAAANLAVYPGRHSVMWEQTVGLGIPLVVKYWPGTTHIDVGGNAFFLKEDSLDEIQKTLDFIVKNRDVYDKMKKVSISKKGEFSYLMIAQKSIE